MSYLRRRRRLLLSGGLLPEGSFQTDGVDDFLRMTWLATAPLATRQKATFSYWMWLPTTGGANRSNTMQALSADGSQWCYHFAGDLGVNNDIGYNDSGAGFTTTAVEIGAGLAPGAWHHVVAAIDTTAAAGQRIKVWLDGVQTAALSGGNANAAISLFQAGWTLDIGGFADVSTFNNCRYAYVNLVGGQALTAADFGFDDSGVWSAKPYTGAYSPFGFRIDGTRGFNDASGNGYKFVDNGGVTLLPDLPPRGGA